jgi:hypothetical protein
LITNVRDGTTGPSSLSPSDKVDFAIYFTPAFVGFHFIRSPSFGAPVYNDANDTCGDSDSLDGTPSKDIALVDTVASANEEAPIAEVLSGNKSVNDDDLPVSPLVLVSPSCLASLDQLPYWDKSSPSAVSPAPPTCLNLDKGKASLVESPVLDDQCAVVEIESSCIASDDDQYSTSSGALVEQQPSVIESSPSFACSSLPLFGSVLDPCPSAASDMNDDVEMEEVPSSSTDGFNSFVALTSTSLFNNNEACNNGTPSSTVLFGGAYLGSGSLLASSLPTATVGFASPLTYPSPMDDVIGSPLDSPFVLDRSSASSSSTMMDMDSPFVLDRKPAPRCLSDNRLDPFGSSTLFSARASLFGSDATTCSPLSSASFGSSSASTRASSSGLFGSSLSSTVNASSSTFFGHFGAASLPDDSSKKNKRSHDLNGSSAGVQRNSGLSGSNGLFSPSSCSSGVSSTAPAKPASLFSPLATGTVKPFQESPLANRAPASVPGFFSTAADLSVLTSSGPVARFSAKSRPVLSSSFASAVKAPPVPKLVNPFAGSKSSYLRKMGASSLN